MTQNVLIKRLKIVMVIGLSLILLGHYILSYSGLPEKMGISGFILGAGCVALGLIMSLPTKMYLTFVWVTKENKEKEKCDNQGKSE